MKYRVLLSAPYLAPAVDEFRPFFKEHDIEVLVPRVRERLEEGELLKLVPDLDGVICGDDRFTARVLERAKRLKVIAKWGTGIDSIDRAAASQFGILVFNTPNAFTEPVADSVLGYLLSFARQIPWSTALMRAGKWRKIPGFALREKVLGVIGVGNIGRAVIRRATAFGMRTIGTDTVEVAQDFLEETGTEMMNQVKLLRQADFISLNCDLNPSSFHLIGKREFSLMKPGAYLINTARGPIIEERELIRALKNKRLAGAALDVFEVEPLPGNSPLRKMKNCLMASHNANSSPQAWEFVHQNTLNNLLKGLREGKRK